MQWIQKVITSKSLLMMKQMKLYTNFLINLKIDIKIIYN